MRIRSPVDNSLYEVTAQAHQELTRGRILNGNTWMHDRLQAYVAIGRARRLEEGDEINFGLEEEDAGMRPVNPVPAHAWRAEVVPSKPPVRKRTKIATTPAEEPLNTPIIPELDEEGNKRLYKTRYNLLEKKYADLHNRYQRSSKAYNDLSEDFDKLSDDHQKLGAEYHALTLKTVDADRIEKRMKQIAKELNLEIPNLEGYYPPLSDKVESFLGTILCRVRNIEEEQDELAD